MRLLNFLYVWKHFRAQHLEEFFAAILGAKVCLPAFPRSLDRTASSAFPSARRELARFDGVGFFRSVGHPFITKSYDSTRNPTNPVFSLGIDSYP